MNDKIISGKALNALATFVVEVRARSGGIPWQDDGVQLGLARATDLPQCKDAATLGQAAIRAAADPGNKTPAVLSLDGKHWHGPTPDGKLRNEAYYGPTATFCPHEVADEDDGRTRKCLMVLIPDEACTHHRPRRTDTARVVIERARADLAAAQGSTERSAGDEQALREAAKGDAA